MVILPGYQGLSSPGRGTADRSPLGVRSQRRATAGPVERNVQLLVLPFVRVECESKTCAGAGRRTGMRRSLRRGWERLATTALVTTLLVTLVPLTVLPVFAQGEAPEADATVRLIHASPGAPNVDVLVDGQPVVEGVPYGTTSEYVPITAEEHRIQ